MISIIFPTRNRTEQLLRLFKSLKETVSNLSNIEIILHILKSDSATLSLAGEISKEVKVKYLTNKDEFNLPELFNQLAFLAENNIFLLVSDDMIFQTKDWDIIAEKTFKENPKLLILYGPDGIQNGALISWFFLNRFWLNIFGFIFPPQYKHFYIDNWITDVSRPSNLTIYNKNISIQHRHYINRLAKKDETYNKDIPFYQHDHNLYNSDKEKEGRLHAIELIKHFSS